MLRLVPLAALLALSACHTTTGAKRYSKEQAVRTFTRFEQAGLDIGEFPIDGPNAVVDGDTVKVKGLDASLRLLAIDTEETFKHDWERKLYAQGWEEYVAAMRGSAPRPVKMATPAGDDAKRWAQSFFNGVTKVKLERDHPGEIRDYYGRYLAYVFVEKNGEWLNFNLECVRAGWSPYFTKYGRSRRFHAAFVKAQEEARAQKLHIWSDEEQHYPDYAERLSWWNARGDVVMRFEREAEGRPDHVVLTRWDAMAQLEQRLGEEVTVLGSVAELKPRERGPTSVRLARNRKSSFDLVFFDRDVLLATQLTRARGEFVQVRGVVTRYENKERGISQLQMEVALPGQVLVPAYVMTLKELPPDKPRPPRKQDSRPDGKQDKKQPAPTDEDAPPEREAGDVASDRDNDTVPGAD